MAVLAPASRDAHEPESHFTGILLPDQLVSRRDAETRSVRLLMIAIVRDAIDCFQKCLLDSSRRGRRLYREAEAWLMAGDPSSPLAFEYICEGLGLDVDWVRHHLSAWRAREIARAPDLAARVHSRVSERDAQARWRVHRFTRRRPSPRDRPGCARRPG